MNPSLASPVSGLALNPFGRYGQTAQALCMQRDCGSNGISKPPP